MSLQFMWICMMDTAMASELLWRTIVGAEMKLFKLDYSFLVFVLFYYLSAIGHLLKVLRWKNLWKLFENWRTLKNWRAFKIEEHSEKIFIWLLEELFKIFNTPWILMSGTKCLKEEEGVEFMVGTSNACST